MKKILLIAGLTLFTFVNCFAQDDNNDNNDKIREKMSEFIQKRMRLSKTEAERFNPIFMRYFKEWRSTLRENKGDNLILQQRIVELRLRYRNEFKDVVGEKRSNQIYDHQEIFIRELRLLRKEQLDRRPMRRNRSLLE